MKNIVDSAIVRLSSVHELSDRDFTLQKQKALDHGGTGGAVAVLLTPSSKVVLIKRTGLHAGWALPGGTLEQGEDPESGLRREIGEELDLSPRGLRLALLDEKKFRSPAQDELDFDLYIFTGHLDVDFDEMAVPVGEVDIELIKAFEYRFLPEPMVLSDRAKLDILREFIEGGTSNGGG